MKTLGATVVFHTLMNRPSSIRAYVIVALLLLLMFLTTTRKLVQGEAVAMWDAYDFFGPRYSLVADYARAGRLVLWNPWTSGGSPDFAEPQLGALSPVTVLVGAMAGGSEAGFRMYWLLIWFLGLLGIVVLARHLRAPAWGAFVVALG